MSCGCIKPKCGQAQAVSFQCDNDGRDVEFVPLSDFLPRVTLVAKGVPDDVALEYLRQAAHTLARESLLLKRELRLDVQAGVRDYYLDDGDNEQVHYVDEVYYVDEVRLGRAEQCGRANQCGRAERGGNDFRSRKNIFACETFRFEPNDKIILRQTPQVDAESQLFVRYFATPTQNACSVDKLLFDRYHDVVVSGALADLLLMRQYEFTDPQMAMIYARQFQQGITKAKIDVARAFAPIASDFNQWERL